MYLGFVLFPLVVGLAFAAWRQASARRMAEALAELAARDLADERSRRAEEVLRLQLAQTELRKEISRIESTLDWQTDLVLLRAHLRRLAVPPRSVPIGVLSRDELRRSA